MLHVARAFLALILVLPFGLASAQDSPFAHTGIEQDAKRYETYLKANWRSEDNNSAKLRADGERALAKDPRAASRSFAAAVVADDQDVEAWLGSPMPFSPFRPTRTREGSATIFPSTLRAPLISPTSARRIRPSKRGLFLSWVLPCSGAPTGARQSTH